MSHPDRNNARAPARGSPRDSSSDLPPTRARRWLSTQESPTFDGLATGSELIMKTIGGDELPKIN